MARKLKPKKKKRNKRKKGMPENTWTVETKVTKSLADYLNSDDLEFEAELRNKLPEMLETEEEELPELPHESFTMPQLLRTKPEVQVHTIERVPEPEGMPLFEFNAEPALSPLDTIRAIWNTRGTSEYVDAFKECFGMEHMLLGMNNMTEEQTRIFLEFCFDNLADIPPNIVSPVNSDYVDIWREDW